MNITLRPYALRDRPWVTLVNLSFYRAAHGFDDSFTVAVHSALDAIEAGFDGPESLHLIARLGDHPVGCIFFDPETPGIGRIRLFFVSSVYRGQGLGRRLLDAVLDHARNGGIDTIRVSTFESHPEACALYRSAGFRQTGATPLCVFGRNLTQIDFARSTRP